MECKGKYALNGLFCIDIKVEPYWNVKCKQLARYCAVLHIKVEPYWNVKNQEEMDEGIENLIKVEPYWNVKVRESNVF